MIKTGKCPGCGKVPVFGIQVQATELKFLDGRTWHGVIYVCPDGKCHTILGVELDPIAVRRDTVNAVVEALRGKR